MILYILLCGYPPFVSQDNDQEKLFDCILSGQYDFPDEYWKDVSALAKELIQNMLQLAPELRFSAEESRINKVALIPENYVQIYLSTGSDKLCTSPSFHTPIFDTIRFIRTVALRWYL
mgnify:CR=1 FL=1